MGILLLIGGIIFASGSQEKKKGEGFEGVTIRISHHAGPTSDAYKGLFPEFEKNTGAKVIMIEESWTDLLAKHLAEFAAHTGTFDIYSWPFPWMGTYVEGGMVEDLNAAGKYFNDKSLADPNYDMKDFAAGPFEVYARYRIGKFADKKDAIWALPFKFDVQVSQYRKDLFGKAGLKYPETYAELTEVAKKLKEMFPDTTPVVMSLRIGGPITSAWEGPFFSHGGDYYDANMYPKFQEAPGVKAAQTLAKLVPYMPEDALALPFNEVNTMVANGLAAYGENWNAFLPVLLNPDTSKVVDTIAFALRPGVVGGKRTQVIGGWAAGVSTDSKNKEAAFALLQYITGKEKGVEFALAGGSTPRLSAAEHPEVVKKYPFYPLLLEALSDVSRRPKDRSWNKVNTIIDTATSESLLGADPVKKYAQAARTVYETVKTFGYNPEKTGPAPKAP
jgi:multiple sugar transport system substrate-binding protein